MRLCRPRKLPKHHYIPVFYLKQWTTPDGRLIEFSRPFGHVVKPRPTSPDGTGYVRGLNIIKGLPLELSEQFETIIMHRVDNAAADALKKLLSNDQSPWAPKPRSAWTRFLLSLLVRLPERMDRLRQFLMDDSVPIHQETRKIYESEAKSTDLPFEEFLLNHLDQAAFQVVQKVLNNTTLGTHVNNMTWHVVSVAGTKHNLLTSDRPLIITNGVGLPNSHLILPITPTRLFVAVNTTEELLRIQRLSPNEFVRSVTKTVVSNAIKYVWDQDDRQLRFVRNHMSSTAAYDLALMPKVTANV